MRGGGQLGRRQGNTLDCEGDLAVWLCSVRRRRDCAIGLAVCPCHACGAAHSWQQQQQQAVSLVARMQPPIVRTAASRNGATSRGSPSAAVLGWWPGVFWAGHMAHCGFWGILDAACRQRQLRAENSTVWYGAGRQALWVSRCPIGGIYLKHKGSGPLNRHMPTVRRLFLAPGSGLAALAAEPCVTQERFSEVACLPCVPVCGLAAAVCPFRSPPSRHACWVRTYTHVACCPLASGTATCAVVVMSSRSWLLPASRTSAHGLHVCAMRGGPMAEHCPRDCSVAAGTPFFSLFWSHSRPWCSLCAACVTVSSLIIEFRPSLVSIVVM